MRFLAAKSAHFIFASVCIAIVAAVCYFSSLSAPFIWDDHYLVVNNPQIKNPAQSNELFTSTIGQDTVQHSFYRPLQMLSYMLDHLFWQDEPLGFHLTNIFLHALAGICLMEFIWVLSLNRWTALYTSLLFISHPVHTEAVAYISGRADPLVAIFIFLTVGTYIYSCKKNSPIKSSLHVVLGLTFYIFALLSKEQAVIVPFLLILYHIAYKSKIRWAAIIPFMLITGGYAAVRILGLFFTAVQLDNPTGTTLMERVPGAFVALFGYIRLLLLPVNLHMGYGHQTFEFGDSQVFAGFSVFFLLVILFFKQRRDYPLMSFAIGWFLLGLIPVSNLIPVNAYMAEHWLYLPSVGYFILFGMFFGFLYRRISQKWFIELLFAIFLIFQIILTVKQNEVWKDPVALYSRIILHNPSFSKAHYNLANTYMARGDLDKAIIHFESAVQSNPRYADAHNNLGIVYQKKGDLLRAYRCYLNAVEINPHHFDANNNIGNILTQQQRYDEAMIYFRKVLNVNPNYAGAYNNLGILYARQGDYKKAVEHLKRALAIDPNFQEALDNLKEVSQYLKE